VRDGKKPTRFWVADQDIAVRSPTAAKLTRATGKKKKEASVPVKSPRTRAAAKSAPTDASLKKTRATVKTPAKEKKQAVKEKKEAVKKDKEGVKERAPSRRLTRGAKATTASVKNAKETKSTAKKPKIAKPPTAKNGMLEMR
jgi:hypothetical protein